MKGPRKTKRATALSWGRPLSHLFEVLAFDLLRQNGDAVFAHLGKAAFDIDRLRLAASRLEHLHSAIVDGAHEGRVAFEDAEFAFCAGNHNHVDFLGADQLGRGYEFKVERH